MIGGCPACEAGGFFDVAGLGSWLSALGGPGIRRSMGIDDGR